MRITDAAIYNTANILRDRLDAARGDSGSITDEQIRGVIVQARRDGIDVPNLSSERSIMMVRMQYIEL